MPTEVQALTTLYEHPTATLDPEAVRQILDRSDELLETITPLTGLHFVRDVVDDAVTGVSNNLDLSIDVQGQVDARAPCRLPNEDAIADPGTIALTLGVADSSVQRAFTGDARACRVLVEQTAGTLPITISAQLQVDLGAPLTLGSALPESILVRAADLTLARDDAQPTRASSAVSVRLYADGSSETLVFLEELDLGLRGTALIVVRADGARGVRGQDGSWLCGDDAQRTCAPVERQR